MHADKGQSYAEYAVLLAIVVAVFVGMRTYVKRGVQGVLKNNIDELGTQVQPQNPLGPDPMKVGEVQSVSSAEDNNQTTSKLKDGAVTTEWDGTTVKDDPANNFTVSSAGAQLKDIQ